MRADQGIEYQQDSAGTELGVAIVRAPSNRMEDLQPLVGEISAAIEKVEAGQVIRVSRERRGVDKDLGVPGAW